MNLLIIDDDSVGAALALRAAQAGHKVSWYITPKPDNFADITGKGLHPNITKVIEWVPAAAKADFIITTTNSTLLNSLDRFRKRGITIYAPSQAAADLEIKRGEGLKFFEKHKLPVPEYKTFKSLKDAEDFVMDNPEAWVFKTAGDSDDKSLSFVSNSPEQMVQQLRSWQKQGLDTKGPVLLQKKVDNILCEMSVGAYLGPNGFNGPWVHCFEHKKLMHGEKGPNTGEMGSLMKAVTNSKLAEKVLKPLEEDLVAMKAYCDFDLNCIIDKNGDPWILEATARFGWPATNIQLETWEGDYVEQLYDAARGENTIKQREGWSIGVVLAIPDFPYGNFEQKQVEGIPIYGITEENEIHIQPSSVMVDNVLNEDMEESPHWVTAGNYVAVVTGMGETIEDARENVYGIVNELSISNVMYRTDIGEKVDKVLPELIELGYVEEEDVTE